MIRVLIVDDHPLVRQGLTGVLTGQSDIEVVDAVADGALAAEATAVGQADVVLMDLSMPGMSGIDATREIAARAAEVGVLVLTMFEDDASVFTAMRAGARGYLLKDSAGSDLIRAVSAVAEGKSFFSPAIARVMLDDYVQRLEEKGATDRYDLLSEREREVFQLIAEGQSNKAIAVLLSVSVATVETHRAHILQKLDVHNTVDLVLYAVRRGVIS